MKRQPEFELQCAVCRYISIQYKDVMFASDTIASLYLTIPQKARNKKIQKDGFHCPDVMIFEPKGKYNGLFIELKVVSPFKKDGTLKKNEHLENQQRTINDLKSKGYFAIFATGFEEAKNIIDLYMSV